MPRKNSPINVTLKPYPNKKSRGCEHPEEFRHDLDFTIPADKSNGIIANHLQACLRCGAWRRVGKWQDFGGFRIRFSTHEWSYQPIETRDLNQMEVS